MKLSNPFTLLCAFLGIALFAHSAALTEQEIPGPLKEWEGWATWDAKHRDCPTPFNDAGKHVCFWPGELAMAVDQKSATWELGVTVFSRTWVPLPGDAELWPIDVTLNGSPLAVVEHDGKPSVELEPGEHRIAGSFRWEEMPQQIRIPREVGILSLAFEGSKVDLPNWDESGNLWLKRTRVEATDKDAIAAQVWSVIEDGIPLWLRTEIELSVSGKSREEVLGNVVPEGWSIASVKAPIPVAVDDNGLMKAQVRAGKWTIAVDAFRTTNAPEIKFAEDAHPVTATELVGFRARPEFRAAELEGLTQVDVSQTTFPEKWRNLPVYQWPTDQTIHLVEKMRGMGFQKPEGLKISRVFWLDENGGGLTFRDQINGAMQQIWRLDIAEGEELGSVKIGGQSQLITRDPASGAPGVEIRARNLNLQAIGRTGDVKEIPATGWRTPSDGLNVTMNLPPGWRLFALFGADWVRGDWLTSWTLLDLFLLLIFSLAVFRLFGWKAGIVAFLAFGLSYHEPGAPHYTWLFLLFPLALLRVVPEGGARKWIQAIRYIAIALLLLCLVPFVAKQIQSALYPQLEAQGFSYGARSLMGRVMMVDRIQAQAPVARENLPAEEAAPEVRPAIKSDFASSLDSSNVNQQGRAQLESNLFYESKSKIQTGPAEPEWNWNTVSCGWNGPVSADEKIRPVFISLTLHRILTILRVALLVWLGSILLRSNARSRRIKGGTTAATVGLLLTLLAPAQSIAQLPDQEMLDTLRQRLLETSDAFPHAAEIPSVDLKLTDGAISTSAVVHTAVKVAVPMPGKLPSWSPVSVTIDDSPASVVRRDDGYLWVVVPEGVHRVTVEGLLPATTEWAWTFLLKPRRVSIDAPG